MVILVFFLVISVNRRLFRYFGSYSGISVIPVILVNRRTPFRWLKSFSVFSRTAQRVLDFTHSTRTDNHDFLFVPEKSQKEKENNIHRSYVRFCKPIIGFFADSSKLKYIFLRKLFLSISIKLMPTAI